MRSQTVFRPAAFDHGEPINRPNLAPIAGVACVLLALLITLLPAHPHIILFSTTYGSPISPPWEATPPVRLMIHRDGSQIWNGAPVSSQQLRTNLAAARVAQIEPDILVEPSGDAAFGAVHATLHAITMSGMRSVWLCYPSGVSEGSLTLRWPDGEPGEMVSYCEPFHPI